MARIRSINPQATLDEDVATMSMAARLAWAYLPCHADREGRLRDSGFALKAALFPADSVDMEAVLVELAGRRHILRYAIEGRRFIQIRNFSRYQFPHHREAESLIPAPGEPKASPGPSPEKARPSPPDQVTDQVTDPENGKRRPDPDAREDSDARADGMPAHEWLRLFKLAWETRPGNRRSAFYGDTGDAKACGTLDSELARLPSEVRASAELNATAMFAEFFKRQGRTVRERGYPFSFFVQEFGTLRSSVGRPERALTAEESGYRMLP